MVRKIAYSSFAPCSARDRTRELGSIETVIVSIDSYLKD